ncbi:MAG: hypothetical protein ACOX7F_06755 [Eubacteriales bacterium]|jgi:hypothetical protein
MMRKFLRTGNLLLIFVIGLFLAGIGSGIAFAEFSSLKPADSTWMEEMTTKQFQREVRLPANDQPVALLSQWREIHEQAFVLREDNTLEDGLVQFSAELPEEGFYFDVGDAYTDSVWDPAQQKNVQQLVINVVIGTSGISEWQTFQMALEQLKNGRLYVSDTWEYISGRQVEVRANAATLARLQTDKDFSRYEEIETSTTMESTDDTSPQVASDGDLEMEVDNFIVVGTAGQLPLELSEMAFQNLRRYDLFMGTFEPSQTHFAWRMNVDPFWREEGSGELYVEVTRDGEMVEQFPLTEEGLSHDLPIEAGYHYRISLVSPAGAYGNIQWLSIRQE